MTDEFDKMTQPQQAALDGQEQHGAPEDETEKSSDETTGASPGTAQACNDLGLNSLAANLDRYGIKPPGES